MQINVLFLLVCWPGPFLNVGLIEFIEQGKKRFDDLRIEVFAALAANILQCFVLRPCRAVRAVRAESIPNIHQSKYTGCKGNLFSL